MTSLRDARLHRALEEAPDAALRPSRATHDAIRAAAQDALRPWWRRWWSEGGSRRWAPAFATVLLAGLVTVLWQGQEVPGARSEPAAADQAVPASATPPRATDAVTPRVPEAEARAQPGTEKPAPAPRQRPLRDAAPPPSAPSEAPAPPSVSAPARAPAPAPAPAPPPSMASAPMAEAPVLQATPPPVAASPPMPAPAAPAPPTVADAARRGADETRPRQAPAALSAQRAASPALSAAAGALPEGWARWTQARIESDGASVVVPREQAGALPGLLEQVLRTGSGGAVGGGGPQLRIELAQDGEALGVLEATGPGWRWRPLGGTLPARGLAPSPALDAQLREEALRLLGR